MNATTNNENEIWKEIEGFKNFRVSNLGRVQNISTGNFLGKEMITGYVKVMINGVGIRKNYFVHRLVAEVFLSNPENKAQVNHINGIKTDNRAENLEWCTASENLLHAVRSGLKKYKKGEAHHLARVSNEDVNEIKRLRSIGLKLKEIAGLYNVSESYVSMVSNNIKRKVA